MSRDQSDRVDFGPTVGSCCFRCWQTPLTLVAGGTVSVRACAVPS